VVAVEHPQQTLPEAGDLAMADPAAPSAKKIVEPGDIVVGG